MSRHDLGSTPSGCGGGALTRMAIAKAKAGDSEGVHYLYVRFYAETQAYAMSFVRERDDAAEIAGRVFADLTTEIAGYDATRGPFETWLTRLAHAAALEHLRSRRPLRSEQVELPGGSRELLFYED